MRQKTALQISFSESQNQDIADIADPDEPPPLARDLAARIGINRSTTKNSNNNNATNSNINFSEEEEDESDVQGKVVICGAPI